MEFNFLGFTMVLDPISSLQTLLTFAAMLCVNVPSLVRYGCLFGTISQPFWYVIAFRTGEAGLLFTTTIITLLWLRGVWSFWIKPWLENKYANDGSI